MGDGPRPRTLLSDRIVAPPPATPSFTTAPIRSSKSTGTPLWLSPASQPLHGRWPASSNTPFRSDRRATAGNTVVYDRADKVLEIDRHSLMAIAGVPATAWEMARVLEHSFPIGSSRHRRQHRRLRPRR